MSDLIDYIDIDGLVGLHPQTEPKTCGSQNGFMYTALAWVLVPLWDKYDYADTIRYAFEEFGYKRNSITNDVVSFDDLFAMIKFIPGVDNDFKKNWFMHPARPNNNLRWFFGRNPVFVGCVYRPNSRSFLRDLSIAFSGMLEDGATPFLVSFLLSELYPTSEWAKRQLRKRAEKRWPKTLFMSFEPYGLHSAFIEYFGIDHPLVGLMAEFERKRNESK